MSDKNPNVISFKKHQEELTQLNGAISTYLGEIQHLKIELESKKDSIVEFQQLWQIEKDANESVRRQLQITVDEFNKAKEYWETNTKTLHNELHKYSETVKALENAAKEAQRIAQEAMDLLGLKNERIKLLEARKWYHFF